MGSLWGLLGLVLLAARASARSSPTDGASGGQGCQAALSYSSVFMPQAELVWRVELTGTRNFTCRGGLEFGPALGVAEGELDGLECKLWYESPFLGKAVCTDPTDGREVGRSLLDTTIKGAVFVLPAPNNKEDDAWGSTMTALWSLLALLALAPGGCARSAPTDGASGGQGCRAALSFDSVMMPAQAELVWRMELVGSRNFSCKGGTEYGPAMGVVEGELDGAHCKVAYESRFVTVGTCTDPTDGREVGRAIRDTSVKGSVFVLPAPDVKEDAAWGRFKISTSGVLAPANYMVRFNTSGGAHPEQCTAGPGEWQLVPFRAMYEGYLCQ
ncbi:hypothetical protein C2E21_9455 [Chlorella sorokiniana]|uniref:Uncharacterized protein n=1 Tax=Chlorella sorokiniana TaxID=3076 RepID=A0A2P6TBA8_CHLSO|nr:hypothetical protein C2E21_9455 [Chlorella sorokiniana]|eukprot:PRW05832.1 hypothetical protein C2E21_9455 [Chlorella sorokiniana]